METQKSLPHWYLNWFRMQPRKRSRKSTRPFDKILSTTCRLILRMSKRALQQAKQGFSGLRANRSTGIGDTVEELRHWATFQEQPVNQKAVLSEHIPSNFADDEANDEPALQVPQTIRYSGPRVGRNDPCSCGSGKKYKKCCGRP